MSAGDGQLSNVISRRAGGRQSSFRAELRLGVSLTALSLALPGIVLLPQPAEAGCTTIGNQLVYQCDTNGVNVQPVDGTTSLSVSDMTIPSGWINYSVAPAATSSIVMTLTVSNTTVNATGNGAVNVSSQTLPATITVTLDSDVSLTNTGGSGGLWVRNQVGGDISITSGATIISTGSDALTATSNSGSVTITNTGTVTSTDNRGIYADGSPVGGAAVPVTVNNSGLVNAYLAGIRSIDYLGTSSIENSGTVTSTTKQGLIAWSQSGDVSINNSGSVLARNFIGVQGSADAGNVTIANSGYIEAQRDSSLGPSTTNQGIAASGSNNVTVTNTSTGRVIAGSDTGVAVSTDNGILTVTNAGRITGTGGVNANATVGTVTVSNTGTVTATGGTGIVAVSGNGAVGVTNSGTVSATGIGILLDGTTNALTNSGTITTTGTTAVQTGNGDSTITTRGRIAAASASDTAIAMGSGSNRLVLADSATLVGKVTNVSSANTLELNGSATGSLDLGSVGATGNFQGFANLAKSGTGTWTVTGSGSSLTGTAVVNAGTLAVQGALGVSSLTVGSASTATLAISNGGTLSSTTAAVNASGGASALVTIAGTGSAWTNTGLASIGTTGTGSLTIGTAAQLTSDAFILGEQAGASGTATVSGTNSGLTISTYMKVGNLGTGSLTLSSGATASVGQVTYIGDFDNNSPPTASGSGSLTLSGAGTLFTTQGLYLRNIGAQTSSLQITGGAVLDNLLGLYTSGSNSSIYVNGANTALKVGTRTSSPVTWSTSDGWFSPDSGHIEVSGGALLDADGSYIGGNGTATMLVTGAGTRWLNGLPLYIGGTGNGNPGNGTVTVSDGAYVKSSTSAVGVDPGAVGTLTLTGTGTIYEVVPNAAAGSPGNMRVGFSGTGTVTVTDGALLRAANQINIATNAGSVGVLSIGGAAGAAAAAPGSVDGGTLGIVFGDGSGKLVFNHTGAAYVFASAISGTGEVVQQGPGTTILTGDDSGFSGTTSISGGTLQIGNGGTTGTLGGNISLVGGTLAFNRSDSITYAGSLSGGGALVKSGSGTLTLTGANSYTGGTTITAGTLQIGNGSTSGSISGAISNAGTLTFNRSDALTYGGAISGSGSVFKYGTGTLTLTGASTYTGLTSVQGGGLAVNGSLAGNVTLGTGTTLSGSGSIAGNVRVNGGTLSGNQTAPLTMGSLTLASASNVNVTLGAASSSPAFNVLGSLTLDGTLNVTANPGFGTGVYRLFNYGGGLTDNGLNVTPVGGLSATVQTAIARQVNLVVTDPGQSILFWNGGTTTPAGQLWGGPGTWTAGPQTNWSNAAGTLSQAWNGNFAVFQSWPGKVTVDASAGPVTTTGMQFVTSSYEISGDAITLTGSSQIPIRVGDGTAAGAGTVAFMNAKLTGTGGLNKTDLGTLVIGAYNDYTGGTTISAGTLWIGNDVFGPPGNIIGDIVNNSKLVFGNNGTYISSNNISGTGLVDVSRAGLRGFYRPVIFTGTNTYTGGTIVPFTGILQIGNGGTTGSIVGDVANDGELTFARSDAVTFSGIVSGRGDVFKSGTGTLTLSGSNTYTGRTEVQAGSLVVTGSLGGTRQVILSTGATLSGSGSIGGRVEVNGGTLAGTQAAPLTMGALLLASQSNVNVTLGAAGGSAPFNVLGNLTLDGTLNVTADAGFGAGSYRIFGYGGTLTDNGLDVSRGGGFVGVIQTSVAGQVNLLVSDIGQTMQFWNGTTTTATGTVVGGSGTWTAGPQTNWTNAAGTAPQPWSAGFAIFQGAAGTVRVDTSAGTVATTGMQFVTNGYLVTGDALTLSGTAQASIRVGDGSAAGAGTVATIASALTGTGGINKNDLGKLILTGTNTYTGGTTVTAGTLVGSTTSLTGSIIDNAALVFNQTTTGTYSGTISGTGSLTKTGAGTLILTGTNTYTGGTLISEGTLQIGNGGASGSIVGNVVNNATLVFNRSGTYDFPGTITGSGAVIITGGSTVNFTSAAGYNGNIGVADSSFVLSPNAVSRSSYTIGTGGTISGTGTIGGLTVASGGTAAPGYSPGTLTVAGNVTFLPGSVYSVDVTPSGAHDLITASGTASILGGTVAVNATAGGYSPVTTLTILQASGGVSGTFASVTSNLAFLTPLLSYDANDVYLTLRRNDISFASQALTANQRAVAGAADGLGWSNPVYYALANLPVGAAPAAFDSLSGEAYASSSTVMLQQSIYLRDAVGARLGQALAPATAPGGPETAALAPGLTPTLWMQGFGAWGNAWGNGNAASVSSDIAGVFGGADVALGDRWRVGLMGGYSRTTLDANARNSSGTIDNYDIGLYAGARYGDLGLKAGVSYTWHDAAMTRSVVFSGYSGRNTSGYDAGTTQVFGEAGYTFRMNGMALEPFAGLAYVHLATNGLTETGSTSALSVSTGDMDTVFSSLGLRVGSSLTLVPGLTVSPSLSLAWLHAFGDVAPASTTAFATGSQPFTVTGVPLARDSALIGAGLDYRINANAVLSATYSGQFASGIQDNAFKGMLTVNF